MVETFSFDDPLLDEVKKLKDVSIHILQLKFRIGYIRAIRLVKEIEKDRKEEKDSQSSSSIQTP